MSDRSQRTEKPTPRRLEKARKDGKVPVSRDLVAGVQFVLLMALAAAFAPEVWTRAGRWLLASLSAAFQSHELSAMWLQAWTRHAAAAFLLPCAGGAALVAAGLGTHLGVTGLNWTPGNLRIDWSRLSPGRRLKEIGRQNLPQALQALLLIPLVSLLVWAALHDHLAQILALPRVTLRAGVGILATLSEGVLWKVSGVLFLWGCIDLIRQKRRLLADLKMTRQEIRDEAKETDGNPQIRSKLRRMQRELARRKMMARVPEATAVVVNPTHFAVAIQYQPESMAAPTVIAKGKNWLALKIRTRAVEHGIPIIENPPLAQALYRSAGVGQEIPATLYRAVAEILAYVFHLRRRPPARRPK